MSRIVFLIVAVLMSCSKQEVQEVLQATFSSHHKSQNQEAKKDKKKDEKKKDNKPKAPPGMGVLQLTISGTPAQPYNSRFRNDWHVRAYNIDDYGRRLGPTYFGWTDFGGNLDLNLPLAMFSMPIVVKACNDAAPHKRRGTNVALKTQEAFIPPFCHDHRIIVDPISTAMWRDLYALGTRFGAQSWTPSNVDCKLWGKSGVLLYLLPRVQATLSRISQLDNILIPIIPALRENPFIFYKTRHPECVAELRHDGGGLKEGRVIDPQELDNLDAGNGQDTPTVGRNGLIATLCPQKKQPVLFRSSLAINGETLSVPNTIYELESSDFVGNVASWQSPPHLADLTIREYTVRHTNGYPRDHDMFAQVCSATALTIFDNNTLEPQELKLGTGLILENLFGEHAHDTAVFATSDGDQTVTDQDSWAIFFNKNTISIPKDLLGLCNPQLFCRGVPNFKPELIEEVIIVELLGFRTGTFRDVLKLDFNLLSENLFIGQRADYILSPDSHDGEQANFMTTVTYVNKKNVNRTLSLCNEAADYLSRQHIDQIIIDSPMLLVTSAAEMIANSKCFSNSIANQRWQNYSVGLWSMNNHKGVAPNFFIPFAWAAPTVRYDIFLKKFNESVFKGPITSVMPALSGLSLEIPTLTEGDEILFASEAACCQDFKVTVPCTPQPSSLPPPGMPVLIDTTGINSYRPAPPTGTIQDLLPKPPPKPQSEKPKEPNKPAHKKSALAS